MARSDQSLLAEKQPGRNPGGLFCILRAVYVPEKSPFVSNFCAGGCRPLLRLVYWVHAQARAGTGICPEVRVYSGSTGGIVLHILFLAIWTANVFALWKNGPAKASRLGAALGVFFLVWGVGGRGAVWLGRGGHARRAF